MEKTSEVPSALWTVRDAATRLASTTHALYKMVERKEIPHLRVGRRIRFDPAVMAAWLKENSVPSSGSLTPRTPTRASDGEA